MLTPPKPIAQGFLPTAEGHDVAWYEYGNPQGQPVLFLHGGPGSGFNPDYLDFFPLEKVRFITFDQRGTGASSPFAELKNNTTAYLLADIERLRKARGVESFIIAGHSWGATLAIIYAKAYPQACQKIILASFFGAQEEDQNWTFSGVREFFPEEVEALHALQTDKNIPFAKWVKNALEGPNRYDVAYRLSCLTGASCRLEPTRIKPEDINAKAIARWQVLMHYGANNFFLKEGEIYEGLDSLSMPVYALHGRFDMDCPPAQVMRLKKSLPSLELSFVAGNHSVMEEPMHSAFKQLINRCLFAV